MIGIFDQFYKKWNIVDSPFEKERYINYPQQKYRIQDMMMHQDPLFNNHKDVLPQSGTWKGEYVDKIADANDVRGLHGRVVIKYL